MPAQLQYGEHDLLFVVYLFVVHAIEFGNDVTGNKRPATPSSSRCARSGSPCPLSNQAGFTLRLFDTRLQ